jgi:hypothetical protein
MGDGRVGDFVRRISLRACEKIAGWAQVAADRLRRTGDPEAQGRALPSTDALLQLGDAAREYSGHRPSAAPPPSRPANGAAPNTVDIPVMRKLGEALNRPMPGTTKRVSSAAARGRSTTGKAGAPKPAPSADQAGHLRRSGADPQQPRKPHQR